MSPRSQLCVAFKRVAMAGLLLASAVCANAGTLTGSVSSSTSTTTISSYGTLDWRHWGYASVPGPDRMSGASVLIPDYTVTGSPTQTTTGARGISWSGGTPNASVTGTKYGVAVAGAGKGFKLSLPADAQARTVRVYVGGNNSSATFSAHLSDGSAVDYSNAPGLIAGAYARQYTISYSANGPGRTLDLSWTMVSGSGSVHVFAAAAPTFTYVNHAPTFGISASYTLQLNQSAFVASNGSDVDGDTLTYSATGLPTGLTINSSSGVISGTPTVAGTYSASVKVTDAGGLSSTAPVSFTVANSSSNHAPGSVTGTFTTPVDTQITITPSFIDPDVGDAWTLVLNSQPSHGIAAISGMQVIYTPTTGYVGPDSFDVRVVDKYNAYGIGTISGTVQSVVPGQVTGLTASTGTVLGAVNLSWSAADSANDYYVYRGTSASDPSPVQLGITAGTSYADTTATAGTKYYYSVKSHNSTAYGTVSAAVQGFADTAPSSVSATFAATLETPINVTAIYTDPDAGDTATFAIITQPAHGSASVTSNQITYTPAAGYVGSDAFTFSVTDRAGASATGTASGTVTALAPQPVGVVTATQGTLIGSVQLGWSAATNAKSYKVLRGNSASDPSPATLATVTSTSYSDATAVPGSHYYYSIQSLTVGQSALPSPSVMGYADTPPSSVSATFAATLETTITVTPTFTDPDAGDTVQFAVVAQPVHGSASVSGNQITYTPAAGYVGSDSFTFSVTDKAGASAQGTASGTVTALTPSPVTTLTASQGTLVGSVQLSWVAASNAKSYKVLRGVSASDPSPTTLATTSNTSYSDTAASAGTPFYYSVQSLTIGQAAAASTPVMGYADTPPSGVSATFAATLETPVTVTPVYTDPDSGDTATFAIVTQPTSGSAAVSSNQITYTPASGYVGADSFTFSVTDKAGASTTGTASGTVTALAPQPVGTVTATQGTLLGAVQLGWSAATNAKSYKVLRGTSASDPSPVAIATVATTTYNDDSAAPGTQYYYSIQSLTIGQSAAASSTVLGYADTPPTAVSATFAASLETPIIVTPSLTDPDAGDTAQFTIATQPAHGSASVNNNKITYAPAAGYVGGDSFTFTVTDRAGASIGGTAVGTVTALPPLPVDSVTATQGSLIGSVQLNWTVATNARSYKVLRADSPSDPSPVTVGSVATTSFTDTSPLPGKSYYYAVQAETVGQSAAPSAFTLGFADTPPSGVSATFGATLETPVTVTPVYTDPDSGDTATFAIVTQPTNGSAGVSSNQITYTPASGYVGTDSFTFSVTDKAGASTTGTASGTVTALAPQPVGTVTATQGTLLGAVQLGWSAATNAKSYKVLRGTSASDPSPVAIATVASTTYNDASAAPGTQYYYSIQSLTIGQSAAASSTVLGYADTPPSAVSATFAATLETPIIVTPSFTDPDAGDTAQFAVVSQPAHGSASVANNQITYTPAPGYVGPDMFTVSVTDRAGAVGVGTASGLVTALAPQAVSTVTASQGTSLGSVQINWSAAVNARSYKVLRGASASDPSPSTLATVTGTSFSDMSAVPGTNYYYAVQSLTIGQSADPSPAVLGFADTPPSSVGATFLATLEAPVQVTPSFFDPDPGDSATFALLTQPLNGTAVLQSNQITYTPNIGFVGTDSFTFSVTDRAGASSIGTASGTVTALPPQPVSTVTATQGTLLGSVQLLWTPAANARSYMVLRGSSTSDPSPVTLATVATTSYSDSTAAPGVNYYYSIQALTIGQSAVPSSSVLGYADTPPSAVSASFAATLETPTVVTPTYTDPDAGDFVQFAVMAQPAHGSASATNNQITYTPAAGYVGPDSFTFSATDRAGAVGTGTASGLVTAITPQSVTSVTASQGTLLGQVQLNWTASTNARSYSVLRGSSPSDPSPSLLATQAGTSYADATAAPGQQYFYSIVAVSFDKSASPSVAVLGYADTPPTAASASFDTTVGVPLTITPSFTDPDPNESFNLSIVSSPSNGTATVIGQSIMYTPANGYTGPDLFTFKVTDKAGASTVGTASGNVNSIPPDPIAGLTATRATRVNAVDINWATARNAATYSVFRSTDQNDPAPALLSTLNALAYTDSTVLPGDQFYYFVRGNNPFQVGPMSNGVLGFADTPPTALDANFSTLGGKPVLVVPTWVDNDPGESFTLTVVTPPSHGSAEVVNNQLRYTPLPEYTGSDSFQFSVTDRAGASATGVANGVVSPGTPLAPSVLIVSQGTILGAVKLDWHAELGSKQYLVQRSDSAKGLSSVIATVSTNTFSDTNVTPGATYFYRVVGVGEVGNSPPSQQVSGYSDTPPTSTSAAVSTVFNTTVEFVPTVVDADPQDTFTVRIDSVPANGTVVVSSDQRGFRYSPNTGWSGKDAFAYTAIDQAGAPVSAVASVSVGCPSPTLEALAISQPKLFAGSGFKISTNYGNTGCPATLSSTLEVMSGTTLVFSSSQINLSGVVSAPIAYAVDSLQAGSYSLKVTVTDTTTGNAVSQSLPLSISGYRMPTFTATGSLFANLDQATIAVGSSPDCQITSDRAAALADHRLCYFEVAPIPPGLTPVAQSALPTWSGKVSTAANYVTTLSVYQYDDFGVPKLLGAIDRTMTVLPLQSMSFVAVTPNSVAQYIEEGTVTVKQTGGTPCQITTDRATAIKGTNQGTRMCFLEFASVSPFQTLLATGVRAPFLVAGTASVNWSVSTFDLAGNQMPFATGSADVKVVPPDIQFTATAGSTNPIATVTSASIRLTSTGSASCSLTVNAAAASVAGVDKPCLVEWTAIPDGLAQSTSVDVPTCEFN